MRKNGNKLLALLVVLIIGQSLFAQPFASEISDFKKQDSIEFPKPGLILFVGSSSFTKWKDVQDYFPDYPIINRGFGGSSLPDVIYYAKDIIYPYHPKQVVIYCGDNDLAASSEVTGQVVLERFKTLFKMIRENLPDANIAFVSLKPSPSRLKLMPKAATANKLVKKFIGGQKNASFIDVYHKMLTTAGKPIPEIFVSDSLHMNSQGYAIWKKAIQPYLKK